ncbi:MAG: hypothetical protein AB7U73_17110 [Pirellulales bacterium]
MSAESNVTPAADLASSLPYIRWALRHAGELPQIIAGCRAVKAADGLQAKWAAFKASGDTIVASLVDFPNIDELLKGRAVALAVSLGVDNVTEADVAAVAAEFQPDKLGDGAILKLILENLPMIVDTVLKIIGLFA